jgi:tetratricopeptide (TPR) repeat protein
MKIQSTINVALLTFLLVIAFAPAQARSDASALSNNLRLKQPSSAVPCGAIVGQWRWFTGGVVTIKPGGTMVYASANDGVWTCTDPSRNAVTLRWRQGGFVNRLVLSADGTRLSSTDRSQSYVSAKRIGEAQHNTADKHPTGLVPQVSPQKSPQVSPPERSNPATTNGYSTAHAIALERRHNWNGLVEYGKAWTRDDPNNATAWAILSVGYFKLNRPDLALGPGKRSVALDPKNPHAWLGLGVNYFELHRYVEAADAFHRSIQLDPHNPTAWNDLAVAYSYEPESKCQPDANSPVALCGQPHKIFQVLVEQERIAGPYQHYIAWYNLGNAFKTVGMQAEMNRFQGGTVGPAQELMQLELKAFIHARDAYRKALHMNSNYAAAWNNLGVVESKIGHWQTALGYYQRAAALGDPLSHANYVALKKYIAFENQIHCLFTRVPLGGEWYRVYPSVCLPESAFNRSGPIPIPR